MDVNFCAVLQGPAHVLEGSQSNSQTAKGRNKEAVYQQRASWLDGVAAQKRNSLSVCAPDHAPSQSDHLHMGAVAQASREDFQA